MFPPGLIQVTYGSVYGTDTDPYLTVFVPSGAHSGMPPLFRHKDEPGRVAQQFREVEDAVMEVPHPNPNPNGEVEDAVLEVQEAIVEEAKARQDMDLNLEADFVNLGPLITLTLTP